MFGLGPPPLATESAAVLVAYAILKAWDVIDARPWRWTILDWLLLTFAVVLVIYAGA